MAPRVDIGKVVQVRRELRALDPMKVAHEGRQIRARRGDIVGRGVHLGSIAGREYDAFMRLSPASQGPQRRLYAPLKIDPLTQVDRRGPVTEADNKDVHRSSEIVTARQEIA